MEATALSLAKLTLDTVLPVAKNALADDAMLLLGVHEEVSFITNELEMMQAFLRAAGAGDRARNEVVKIWVKQVHDLAYDVEDCLQEYLALDLGAGCNLPPFGGWLRACAVPAATQLRAQHQIAVRIRQVKGRVEEVSKRNLRYSIVVQPGPAPSPAVIEDQVIISRDFAADVATEESQLVGRDRERDKLVGDLVRSESDAPLQVLAVYGMGGVGKTVLAREVLRSPELAQAFQLRAWVTVPHPLGMGMADFIRSLARQLDIVRHGSTNLQEAVVRVVRQLGDKRYAVVVDDVSTIAEWEQIKKVLPEGKRGSWIIATTRDKDVAEFCSAPSGHVHELSSLAYAESLRLLCKKAHINDGPLMGELMEMARSILESCRGLPLAVGAVGRLLATKMKSPVEWKKLHDHLGSELKNNPGLGSIKDVLTSSYDALPYHLKSCFLYLSVFPKYRELRQVRVSWRWMAEGLVAESPDMDPDDVGEGYFNQLISRNMMQPATTWVNLDDRINTGQVHDMMREIILAKSAEESQLFVLNNRQLPSMQRPREKVRHLVVSSGVDCHWEAGNDVLASINLSHVRSLTVDGECPPRLIIPSKMKMLRVLDLEDCPNAMDAHVADIGELRHLKYLGLRGTGITRLPESLGRLKFLQSIDIRRTNVTIVPQGLTKLEKLRHLMAGNGMRYDDDNRSCSGVRLPGGFGRLRSMHNLGRVVVGKDGQRTLRDISKLIGLSSLEITELTDKGGAELRDTLRELVRLEDLEVRARGAGTGRCGSLRCLESILSPPQHLVTLRLCGYLGRLPSWVGLLQGVTKIKLVATELKQDAVEALGDLPSLTGLHLWRESYVGQRLHLRPGKFAKLKLISIDRLEDLVSLVIEEESMPSLQWLWLKRCRMLSDDEDGVVGVTFLPQLKEVRVKFNDGDKPDKPRLHAILRMQLLEKHPNRPQFMC